MKKFLAEALGTMVLVLMGCGSAIFFGCTAGTAQVLAVAFAFGLSVVGMAYCIGGISGCHINPAITLGVWLSKRMPGKEAVGYMISQFIGALVGSALIYLLTSTGSYGPSTSTGAHSFTEGQMGQAFMRKNTSVNLQFRVLLFMCPSLF